MKKCSDCGERMKKVDETVDRVERGLKDVMVNHTIWACHECGREVEGHARHVSRILSEGIVPVDKLFHR